MMGVGILLRGEQWEVIVTVCAIKIGSWAEQCDVLESILDHFLAYINTEDKGEEAYNREERDYDNKHNNKGQRLQRREL